MEADGKNPDSLLESFVGGADVQRATHDAATTSGEINREQARDRYPEAILEDNAKDTHRSYRSAIGAIPGPPPERTSSRCTASRSRHHARRPHRRPRNIPQARQECRTRGLIGRPTSPSVIKASRRADGAQGNPLAANLVVELRPSRRREAAAARSSRA